MKREERANSKSVYMKKNITNWFFAFALFSCLSVLASCNKDIEPPKRNGTTSDSRSSFRITQEEACNDLMNFLALLDKQGGSKLRSSQKRQIKSVETILQQHRNGSSLRAGKASTDGLFYLVNFEDSAGYAIIAADKRIKEPILAIIDQGNTTSANLDDILADLDPIDEWEREESFHYMVTYARELTKINDAGWTIGKLSLPRLDTKWGQQGGYNKYCLGSPAGCGPIAGAQILAYFNYLKPVLRVVQWRDEYNNSGTSGMDWKSIIRKCREHDGELPSEASEEWDQVANLIRYVGLSMKASYGGEDGTGTSIKNEIAGMRNMGLRASDKYVLKPSRIESTLDEGDLIFAGGYTRRFMWITWGGHSFVIDGYVKATKDGKQQFLPHINWGWRGTDDGYYSLKLLRTSKPVISDGSRSSGSDSYFEYDLHMFSVGHRK